MSDVPSRPPEPDGLGPGNSDARTVFLDTASLHSRPPPGQGSDAPYAGIGVGDVLNDIFEVRRFIARGGMGEVFEGLNSTADERVAIKVILPALAADPKVRGMFLKEARTLTRLRHDALVQYRVLAQEPTRGILYIVTEYIDGTNLSDVLATLKPDLNALFDLTRRLAEGLAVAHRLGAIHRDMAPDNILLEDGRLEHAKIIDFGIAKDMDSGNSTIVGDGFAGKLNYVTPEQLGDFGREVGAWTDVYSLALVILAVATGRDVPLGGSLVDAVDKRRAGVDTSGAPPALRPVLDAMLRPDPADRLRTMNAVIVALDNAQRMTPTLHPARARPALSRKLLVGVGGAALSFALVAFAVTRPDNAAPPSRPVPENKIRAAADTGAGSGSPVDAARSSINATLPSVACTWLNIAALDVPLASSGRRPSVALTGVAGTPSAAQREIGRALADGGVPSADIDFQQVSPIIASGCAALDTFRQIRSSDPPRLSVPQRAFEMRMQPAGEQFAGRRAANALVTLAIGNPASDFTLIGIEPSGKITPIIPDRRTFTALPKDGKVITDIGGDRYRLQIDLDHEGWSGLLLLVGKGPFEGAVTAPPLGARGPDWRNRFVTAAAERGWTAEMIWFKSVAAT